MTKIAGGEAAADVSRAICASVSQVRGSVMDELFQLRNRACAAGGPEARVRGALMHVSGWFVLWLEGEHEAVEATLQRAAGDPRNAHQKILHRSRGPATLAEALTVAATQGVGGPAAFGRRIFELKAQHMQGIHHEPAQLWQRLSAPCLPMAGALASPDHHTVLVSAEDNGPIDLLRKLADRSGGTMVYQRFAGGRQNTADVGAAYVDIATGGQVRRIQLLSRRALGFRIVHQSLANLDALLMLLGSRPSSAIELASSVASLLDALPSRPSICLLTRNGEVDCSIGAALHARMRGVSEVTTVDESQLAPWLLGVEPAPGTPAIAQRPPGLACA